MSGQQPPSAGGSRSPSERSGSERSATGRPTQRMATPKTEKIEHVREPARNDSGRTKRPASSQRSPAYRPNDSAEIPLPSRESASGGYPADLAREVRRRLKEGPGERGAAPRASSGAHGPSTAVLSQLFEILHFASMRTEEGNPVTCSVTYMDPTVPDQGPRKNSRPGRWSVTHLGSRMPLTVANLVKLSAAADPRACSLAVHSDDAGNLFCWGMIDQELQQTFSVHEGEKPADRPGLFQATVAPTHITVYRRSHLLASLVHGQLTYRFHDVFTEGRVARTIDSYIGAFGERVRAAVGREVYDGGEKRTEGIRRLWVTTLCRILLAIQAYEKGGALLLVAKAEKTGLNVKYEIAYRRLGAALERLAVTRIKGSHARDRIWTGYLLDDESGDLPGDLYLEEGLATSEEAASLSEIAGCIRFIASLSRADGLVLMEGDLEVKGFGAEITTPEEPKIVLAAGDAAGAQELCRPVDFAHYGLRHRSMMRYCDRTPGSVGFVVSQDGTIRALTRDGERLVLWDNIQLT